MVAELMLARNKVMHIYELVKAYGGTTQVHYNRQSREWQRTEGWLQAIATGLGEEEHVR